MERFELERQATSSTMALRIELGRHFARGVRDVSVDSAAFEWYSRAIAIATADGFADEMRSWRCAPNAGAAREPTAVRRGDFLALLSRGLRTRANKNAGPSGLMFGWTTMLSHHLRAAGADLDSLRSPGPKGPGYPLFQGVSE
jgi:hypothetical protein